MTNVYTLLSIDGGGVRGIFAIELIRLIIEELEKQNYQIHDVIDMYCGVSVGSITASVLAQHNYNFFKTYSEQEDMVRNVFMSRTSLGPVIECKYYGGPKSKAIQHVIGKQALFREVKTNLLILAADQRGREILMHSSNPLREEHRRLGEVEKGATTTSVSEIAKYSVPGNTRVAKKTKPTKNQKRELEHESPDLLLWRAIDASTAAPVYFPPVNIDGKLCIDGGAVSTNPSIIGTHTLRKLVAQQDDSQKRQPNIFRVLSIGAGAGNINSDPEEKVYERDPMQYGLVTWMASGLFDIMTKSNDPILESVMPALLGGSGRFMRLDTTVRVAMDDVTQETFEELRENAQITFKKHKIQIMNWLLAHVD